MKVVAFLVLFAYGQLYAQDHLDFRQAQSQTDSLHLSGSASLSPSSGDQKIITLKAVVVPTVLIGYGFVALHNHNLIQLNRSTKTELLEEHPHFLTHADTYLQFSPAAAVYALNIMGIKGADDMRDRSMIYTLSLLMSSAVVYPLKKITHEQRPDLSGYNSFPSGHTTIAFASAEFLRQEYKGLSPWYGIAGYTAAAATGILRMYNDRHWLSDVVAGAGFGILSTKAAYAVYPCIKRKLFKDKPMHSMIMPYYQQKGAGMAYVYRF